VICPLCRTRKARRGCPALGQQICAVCCGTKRLTEIACPSDCTWLASSRDHPSAATVRRQQQDLSLLVDSIRDFNERQSRLYLLIASFLSRYQPADLTRVIDDDVAEAADAMASTYETAARGVIYEHRPASLPAERLVSGLKPLLAEAGKGAGSSFERDASVVLRRVRSVIETVRTGRPGEPRAYLELLGRVMRSDRTAAPGDADGEGSDPSASRLIVP
jgi:hypothetical protein